MITNSVVPMPNAPAVSAYSASGRRGRAAGVAGRVDIGWTRFGCDAGQGRSASLGEKPLISTSTFFKVLRMDRLDDIALFLRVLDLGSISAAARSLDLSVALAIQRLKRLEQQLGVRLLHRTTRRLHPTAEGIALAERGRALV